MDRSTHNAMGKKTSKKTHWILICMGILIAAIVAVKVFGISLNTVVYFGAILACPLLHIVMMRSGGHKH